MDLEPSVAHQIVVEWQSAPRKGKTKVIGKWAKILGCSRQTIYKHLPTKQKNGKQKKRESGNCKIEGIQKAADTIAKIKKRPPKGRKEITTEDALELAISNGILPEHFKEVSLSTINAHIRAKGLNRKARRVVRFQAERPNQMHHIDATSSECFYVDRRLPDGDYILRLDTRPHKGYKNKIVKIDRLRPWIYGLTDDHSGFHLARYVAAAGESMADNLAFLAWAWSKNEDKVLFGLPEQLKSDCGPLMKGVAAREILDRLGIAQDPSVPYGSEAHGKIERPWRTLWHRFETPFFVENWKTFEIKLSELQRRFLIYQQKYNEKPHRYETGINRADAWRRINHFGGAVEMPENAIASTARRYERTVGTDGCFSLHGCTYEVDGLHDAKVWVYEGVFEDKLVVVDRLSGEKYPVDVFCPLPLGQYKGVARSPHEKAVEAAKDLELHNTLYTESIENKTVTRFPTRTKEIRSIENLLDTDSYPDMATAMREFTAICGFVLDKDNRQAVESLIVENGMDRSFVNDLALEVQAESERSVSNG